ncbi:MAG: minor capsid protein [Chlorobiaceae bacterium]|nr:minor capsid protein [Chlorobiaceae bacterium]
MRAAPQKKKSLTAEDILNPQPDEQFINTIASSLTDALNIAWADGRADLDRLASDAVSLDDATFASDPVITIPGDIGSGNETAAAFHSFRGFAAALVEDQRINDALKSSLGDALKNGIGFEEWKTGIDSRFDSLGVTRFTPFRLNLIYRTETALAFGAAQFARLQEIRDKFPFWEYSAILDQRTRPSHRALDGKIFLATNAEFWPPLGFNCRCTVILLTKAQAQRKGITAPDIITPEMRGNLRDIEFIGDKTGSYNLWLKEQQLHMSQATLDLLKQAFDQLLTDLANAD